MAKKQTQLRVTKTAGAKLTKKAMHPHTGNTQPPETVGKLVRYACGGRAHYPHFADWLVWSTDTRVITPAGIITHYQVI